MNEQDLIKIPYSRLVTSAPEEQQDDVRRMMGILLSMHRDYHDMKGNPCMTFAEHAQDQKLTPEQAERCEKAMQLSGYSYKQLADKGFPIGYPDTDSSNAVDITFTHRKLTYMVAADLYLDFNQPGKVYVFEVS